MHHQSSGRIALGVCLLATSLFAQQPADRGAGEKVATPDLRQRPGAAPGENLLFNGWGMTPAGRHVGIRSDLTLRMLITPDKKRLVAVNGGFNEQGLTLIDPQTATVTQQVPMAKAWNGLAFSADGKRIFVSSGDEGAIHVFSYADGVATPSTVVRPDPTATDTFLAGLTVDPNSGKVFVCNEGNHEVWVLKGDTLALEWKLHVGQHPHSCIIGGDGRHLYVSNWGSRSVSALDLVTLRRVLDINVGLRPNEMALGPDGRLFVACSGDNTVHVIPTKFLGKAPLGGNPLRRLWEGASREIISTSLYPQSPEGSTPDALAVSGDGKLLYVANADNNNVMVVDISGDRLDDKVRDRGESVSIVNGFIPVGWYPSALAVSDDGKTLYVANGKGLRSRENVPAKIFPATKPGGPPLRKPQFDYIGKTLEGSISIIPRPDTQQLAAWTEQVRRNSP